MCCPEVAGRSRCVVAAVAGTKEDGAGNEPEGEYRQPQHERDQIIPRLPRSQSRNMGQSVTISVSQRLGHDGGLHDDGMATAGILTRS